SRAGGLGGDAVGQADGAVFAVVVAGAKPAGSGGEVGSHRDAVEQPELSQIERRLLLVGPDDPNQMVQDLGHADRSQPGVGSFQDGPDVRRSGLRSEKGDDGVGVEDCQYLVARAASSWRACRLALSAVGPRPRYLPSSSSTPSSGRGRTTMRSPKSTTTTRRAFHRERASAGIETWPFRETVMCRSGTGPPRPSVSRGRRSTTRAGPVPWWSPGARSARPAPATSTSPRSRRGRRRR